VAGEGWPRVSNLLLRESPYSCTREAVVEEAGQPIAVSMTSFMTSGITLADGMEVVWELEADLAAVVLPTFER